MIHRPRRRPLEFDAPDLEPRTIGRGELHPGLLPDIVRIHQAHQRPLPALIPKYEETLRALAECRRVDEAKDIRDKAEALQAYARMVHDHEAETLLAGIKLRAIRRIGEISRSLDKSPGGRGRTLANAGKSSLKSATLAAAGISLSAANRAEHIAAIPIQEFDGYLEMKSAELKAVTAQEMLTSVVKRQKVDRRAGVGDWDDNWQLGDLKTVKPGAFLRIYKSAQDQLKDGQKFQLILALLMDLRQHGDFDTPTKWYWKLLARLIDIDGVESILRKLSERLPGREQDEVLKRQMRPDDELFLAVHLADDLEPLLPHRRKKGLAPTVDAEL